MIIITDHHNDFDELQAGTPRSVCMLSNTTAIQVGNDHHDHDNYDEGEHDDDDDDNSGDDGKMCLHALQHNIHSGWQ